MEDLTPEEQAEELINTFRKITDGIAAYDYDMVNIQCAIAAVDKILKSNPCEVIYGKHEISYSPIYFYWKEVRVIIEKRWVK